MLYILSISDLQKIAKYVCNWYLAVAFYLNIIYNTTALFKDGQGIAISKNNRDEFEEAVYRRHLEDKGFSYETKGNKIIVKNTSWFKDGTITILL